MAHNIPPEAYMIATRMWIELGLRCTLRDCIAYVKKQRKRPLYILELAIPHAYLGLCCACVDADVIFIQPHLERSVYIFTLLHELTHVLQGDAKPSPVAYNALLQSTFVQSSLHRQVDATDTNENIKYVEDVANGVAFLFLDDVIDDDIPPLLRQMYGY